MINKNLRRFFFLTALFLLAGSQLLAHTSNQNYIYLRIYGDRVEAELHITKRSLNKVLGLGLVDKTGLDDVKQNLPAIQKYYHDNLKFESAAGKHPIEFTGVDILSFERRDFVILHIRLQGLDAPPQYLDITNNLVVDVVPNHESWVTIFYHWEAGIFDNESLPSIIYTADTGTERLELGDVSVWKGFQSIIGLGMHHIWIGWDHILFIIALILPSVIVFSDDKQLKRLGILQYRSVDPVGQFKPAFFYILKIITLFTVAHSITLSLSALGFIVLPGIIVEPVIALSIAAAAFHNIRPIFMAREWIIAFGFGLFHGFGFAGILAERAMRGEFYALTLLGFNLGVEIGQVAIIAGVFPLLFVIRRWKYYSVMMAAFSVVLIMFSILWVLERTLDFDLPIRKLVFGLFG